ncbi:MAG: RNA methyltransferase [Bdellovibrio sp.]|nr:MAG: RNA methyltransferase [Bdellovibrio sp.]
MAEFFATTAKGLLDPLMQELQELGFSKLERTASGVLFDTNWRGCYRANLESRLASRILKPVLDFYAYQPEDIYSHLRKHDFTKYISPEQTLAVDASVEDCKLRDQRFVAMKAKDAIVDEFRDKYDIRPNVDRECPDLRVWIRGYKNCFHVSLDTTGNALNQRGYRKQAGQAPIKENLAAGLLRLAEWDMKTPLVDPMCGSGTLLIEAALMLTRTAPGSFRHDFAFQHLKGYVEGEFTEVLEAAVEHEVRPDEVRPDEVRPDEVRPEGMKPDEAKAGKVAGSLRDTAAGTSSVLLYGFDVDRKALAMARANAARAGVEHLIQFKYSPISTLQAPTPRGIIVTNPPYAIRLGDEDILRDVYRDFSHTLKTQFRGWTIWILSGNKDLMANLKLKASRKHFVYNGAIECRFLRYDIRTCP